MGPGGMRIIFWPFKKKRYSKEKWANNKTNEQQWDHGPFY